MAFLLVSGSPTGLELLQALCSLHTVESFRGVTGEKELLQTVVTFVTFIPDTGEDSKVHIFSLLRIVNNSLKIL